MNNLIKKLPQSIVNQIAAGEVIERPASVVKELVDNSIDAQADHIKIKVFDGGIQSIEVIDNGIGIRKEELLNAFEPHSTSKISSIEDLNTISTMGFRGEALSTIKSVSKVKVTSKETASEFAYFQEITNDKSSDIKKSAREKGTTIIVTDLFYNIPARKKFLKTPETEYRKILDTLIPYFLIHPEIHFELEKNGKRTINLVNDKTEAVFSIQRIKESIHSDFTENLIPINSSGAGINISGYIAHPKYNQERTTHQYIFVNKRSIWDSGIAKAVYTGFSRYIPHGRRIPFIISIDINPSQIDVNIHPRKEEIKFENPFRLYSQVESVVKKTLDTNIKADGAILNETAFNAGSYVNTSKNNIKRAFDKNNELRFDRKPKDYQIKQGLQFSKGILEKLRPFKSSPKVDCTTIFKNIFQIFNKYIIIELEERILVIDQHAAAERITFDRLLKNSHIDNPDKQQLLVPTIVNADSTQLSFINEYLDEIVKLGFDISTSKDGIEITSVPVELVGSDIEKVIKEILELRDSNIKLTQNIENFKKDLLATVACHTSIRSGQKLEKEEMVSIFTQLKKCENQYSCPHGRPIIWELKLDEIDSKFYRTY